MRAHKFKTILAGEKSRGIIAFNCESAVTIKAEADAEGKRGPATFDVVAYTGGELELSNYDAPLVVDLASLKYAKGLKANLDHVATQRVGHVTDKRNDGKTLELAGIASAATAFRDEVIGSAADGYEWQTSIEAFPGKIVEVKRGDSIEANGRTFNGPLYLARNTTLRGFAFVSHGADDNTSATIAASAASQGASNMDEKLVEFIKAKGFDHEALTSKQLDFFKAQFDSEGGAKKPLKATSHKELFKKEREEVERREAITAFAHEFLLSRPNRGRDLVDAVDKLVDQHIEAGSDIREFKLDLLMEAGTPSARAPIVSGRPRGITENMVLEAAMARTRNIPNLEKHYKAELLECAEAEYPHLGLNQLVVIAAQRNGYVCRPGERITVGNVREILKYAFADSVPGRIAAAASTVSLSGILSNVATKDLLDGYMAEDQTWKEISQVKSVNDFKQYTSYRMLDDMAYEELGANGEIKHGKVSSENYTRQAKTYAKMFALSRNDLVNDDLGAFDDVRNRLGRGGSLKFNDLFWTNFMSNLATTFTAARTNYISGSTTTLLPDGVGLELGLKAFYQMYTPTADGNKRIGGRPEILLVPPELSFAADRLYMSAGVQSGVSSNAYPDANIHGGKYRPVMQWRLSDSSFTGNSTTAWYLFRNPATLPAMVVSFLNGNQTPVVETAEADFDQLGIQFRGYHDFGCDVAEYLAGLMSKGAA